MCELDSNLKLCTCSEKIDTNQPHWRLYRKTIIQPTQDFHVVGMIINPIDSSLSAFDLLEQLNLRNCFDFDYQPLDDDKLVVKLTSEKLEFVYDGENMCWVTDTPHFQEIRRTMQAKGYVKSQQQNK